MNPLTQAGAITEPSNYAPIFVNRMHTGLWTQRNPLRDAATPYAMEKYLGGRYESLLDGLNVELTARLTLARRRGFSQQNSQTFASAIRRFYEFKTSSLTGVESIRLIADTDATIYDATGNTKVTLLSKAAGAGRTTFLGLLNSLYMGNGVDLKKWLQPALTRQDATAYTLGQYVIDSNNNIQQVTAAGTSAVGAPAWNAAVRGTTTDGGVTWTNRGSCVNAWGVARPSVGLTIQTWQAGHTYALHEFVLDSTNNCIHECTTAGLSGGGAPAWNGVPSGTTADNAATWTNRGPHLALYYPWGEDSTPEGPSALPFVGLGAGLRAWQVDMALPRYYSIIDANGNLQVMLAAGGITSWEGEPRWETRPGLTTQDGPGMWFNGGSQVQWGKSLLVSRTCWCLDPAGYIQCAFNGIGGTTGAAAPAWSAVLGGVTNDNGVLWTNCGTGNQVVFQDFKYAYSFHTTEGEMSQASPLARIGRIIGGPFSITIGALGTAAANVDKIRIWRTSDGGATLLKLADIPNPGAVPWTYTDTAPDSSLNALIQGDQVGDNTPPPAGLTNLEFHLGRIWGSVGNIVYYTRTASAVAGSPYSCFPPGNYLVFPSQVVRMWPCAQGMVVFTTSDVYVIVGKGTDLEPLSPVPYVKGIGLGNYDAFCVNGSTAYLLTPAAKLISLDPSAGGEEVGFPIGDQILSLLAPGGAYLTWYEAESGESALYASDPTSKCWFRMAANSAPESGLVWSCKGQLPRGRLAGPYNISDVGNINGPGLAEDGTQLIVSIGGYHAAEITPFIGIGYVIISGADNPAYNGKPALITGCGQVAIHGAKTWITCELDPSLNGVLESGGGSFTVSTASADAFSAMQAVELTPGRRTLLLWTSAAQKIWKRDPAVNRDGGTAFDAWAVVGSIVLAHPGQLAEVEFIALDSGRVGTAPLVGLLLDEVSGDFEDIVWSVPDPPLLPASASLFSDRYYVQQNQQPTFCRHLQLRFTWAAEDAHNELLSYAIFGTVHQEKRS